MPSEIIVTKEMVDAGMSELGDHRHLDDWRYIIEGIYRAMAYEDPAHACSSKEPGRGS
ncbi:MAG: hypothetical protein GY947_13760 [Rhodobacteraceae bacterium]|nr:hypothetical protein [Paracoccaceae bacterium]